MKNIVIFSEHNGWHEQRLSGALNALGAKVRVASLQDCRLSSEYRSGLHLPGFDGGLPDAAFVRAIAAGSFEEVTFRLGILHALQCAAVRVCNDAGSIERTVDKSMTSFLLLKNRVPTPPAWVCENARDAHEIIRSELDQGHAVVQKPLFGNCGRGLKLIDDSGYELDTALVNGVYYLQRFIRQPDGNGLDWRIFVINHRAVAAMQRHSGSWVTNRARGGQCCPAPLSAPLRGLAEAASRAAGIRYGGVDIIRNPQGDYLALEVNSVPAWRGLQSVCRVDIARLLAENLLDQSA